MKRAGSGPGRRRAARVFLVGAGPGDPELITCKGRRLLAAADAVLYDDLIHPALLAAVAPAAELLYVGKRARHAAATQEEIQGWMIERARRGLAVVRLKGGDPMIFGRGGEELEALRAAGVPCEVVPGVSAGTGAPAVAGLALTRRGVSGCVRLIAAPSLLAGDRKETLVVYMGRDRLHALAARLMGEGWPADTPAAVLARATFPDAARVHGRLDAIAALAAAAALPSPALLLVGDAVRAGRGRKRSPPATPLPGLIVMAHGSPLAAWQEGVVDLARRLAAPGQFSRAAFLPPVRPGLGEAVAAGVREGVADLVVVPYFLAAGIHVTRDLPRLIAAQKKKYPRLRLRTAACLEGHPALRTALLSRFAAACAGRAPADGA